MNKSSIFGIGYRSNFETRLIVSLKSPHMRIDFLSDFRMGTMGAAQSENSIEARQFTSDLLFNLCYVISVIIINYDSPTCCLFIC